MPTIHFHFLSMVPKKEKIKQLIITVLSDLFRKKITSLIKKDTTSLESAGNELRTSIQLKSKSRKKWNVRTKESFPNPQHPYSVFSLEKLCRIQTKCCGYLIYLYILGFQKFLNKTFSQFDPMKRRNKPIEYTIKSARTFQKMELPKIFTREQQKRHA